MYYVYALFRENGMPFWIGKGKGGRIKASASPTNSRSHKNSIIKRTRRLLGEVPSVIIHTDLDEPSAFAYEMALIAAIGRYPAGPLANMTDGGDGTNGVAYTEERRGKMKVSMLGNTNAAGTVPSVETRALIAASKIGNQAAKGCKRSPETRAKMSASTRAWMDTPEGRAKIEANAQRHRGCKRTPEAKAKIKAARARQTARDNETKILINLMMSGCEQIVLQHLGL